MSLQDYILASPAFSRKRPPLWGRFDATWYGAQYKLVILETSGEGESVFSDESLERHWLEKGAKLGLSPNPFFDEEWYLKENPDVREGVQLGIFDCGFLHYCESGFLSRAPHWLFSEKGYFLHNPDISQHILGEQGFCNGYDHYLSVGDREERKPHPLFDPSVFRAVSLPKGYRYDFDRSAFSQFIEKPEAGKRRCSWYFDPEWYVQQYPDVADAIENKIYLNPLHHYLTNGDPEAFDPNPWFSESDYARRYPDVAAIVKNGGFRNTYEHFIRFGSRELRVPKDGVDLISFSQEPGVQRRLRTSVNRDIFVLWVQNQSAPIVQSTAEAATPQQYQHLGLRRPETLIPSIIRSPLTFKPGPRPAISAIISTCNQFRETLATLTALHANTNGAIEVILMDGGSIDETNSIHRLIHGIKVVRRPPSENAFQRLYYGVSSASSPVVLLIPPGAELFPSALKGMAPLFRDPDVWMAGGQSLGYDALVLEAGTIIWRDGSYLPYGQGLRANEPTIAFRRYVDAITVGPLLCRRTKFLEHAQPDAPIVGYNAHILSLCLAMRQANGRIVYDPAFLSRNPHIESVPPEFDLRNRTWLRRRYAPLLSRSSISGTSPERARLATGTPTVLFLCDRIPKPELGTPYLRYLDIISGLNHAGYHVVLYPLFGDIPDLVARALNFPPEVEIMEDMDLSELGSFIASRAGSFDYVWINRSPVLHRVSNILIEHAQSLPDLGFIFDLNGSGAAEPYMRRRVGAVDDKETKFDDLEREVEATWACQALVASYAEEAEDLRQLGYGNILTLPNRAPSTPAAYPDFHARSGLLFLLPIHNTGDAVHDGLNWFMHDVLPILDQALPKDVTILLAGHYGEGIDLTDYISSSRVEGLPDYIDRESLLRSRRLLIDPTRVSSIVPHEVLDAAAHGLPAILTETVLQQIGWQDGVETQSGGFCDPQRFAHAVIELYQNERIWTHYAAQAFQSVQNPEAQTHFMATLAAIMDMASGRSPIPVPDLAPRLISKSEHSVLFTPAPLRLQPNLTMTEAPETLSQDHDDEDDGAPVTGAFTPRLGISLPNQDR
ncbi:glycosyltransferase [Neokomagataea thailandica]|uniref:Glycosyl transferase family protein n=1 Tax=Neokomagataea tanensis NBRC 106556 TaxID=1223519 RepID=A0ABQ0QJV9_9PROT|nr:MULTISPECIES: glycosyltransferase [Neokomagataea]GBR47434.1 glycosyl transferase family protein [Neokomagataea tanensis NBRC 106556]